MPERRRAGKRAAGSPLTLPVELFADPLAPLLAHLPDSARVANVSTLQGDLRSDRAGRDCQRALFQQQMHPKPKGLPSLPVCLVVPGPRSHRASLTCLFRKQHFFAGTQTLHSELPLYSSEKERRATVQGHRAFWRRLGVCWPRKAMAWFLLLPHLSRAGRPKDSSQAQVRSFGPHSHSGQNDQLHTSPK